jgi:hypothetical protein
MHQTPNPDAQPHCADGSAENQQARLVLPTYLATVSLKCPSLVEVAASE